MSGRCWSSKISTSAVSGAVVSVISERVVRLWWRARVVGLLGMGRPYKASGLVLDVDDDNDDTGEGTWMVSLYCAAFSSICFCCLMSQTWAVGWPDMVIA